MIMLRITSLIVALLVSWSACAQVPLTGAGKGAPGGVAYQGPGDVVSGAQVFWSCSRVYNLAAASTSTSLCDLVSSSAPTVVLCTLRGTPSGFVDLSAYCAGALTPAATCAAATGGACNISKVYNQVTSGTLDVANATAAAQPKLTFAALNGLPVMTLVAASNTVLASAASGTLTNPFSLSGVYNRTSGTSQGELFGVTGAATAIGAGAGANLMHMDCTPADQSEAASPDASYHAVNGTCAGASSGINVDGVDTGTITISTSNPTANTYRLGRSGGGSNTLNGNIAEILVYSNVALNAAQRGNLNTNQHGTNGYNF